MAVMSLVQARKMWQEDDTKTIRIIRLVLAGSGMTQDEFGPLIGMSSRTLRERMKKPSTFTKGEWRTVEYYAQKYGIVI